MPSVIERAETVLDPRPAPFPHGYEVALSWRDQGGGLLSAPPRPRILGGPPPQFAGRADWWSPEHLLLSAVNLCLMDTFMAMAAGKLDLKGYDSLVKGILDRTPDGLTFTSIVLRIDLRVAQGQALRAEGLLEAAKRYCIVARSLSVPVDLRPVIAEI